MSGPGEYRWNSTGEARYLVLEVGCGAILRPIRDFICKTTRDFDFASSLKININLAPLEEAETPQKFNTFSHFDLSQLDGCFKKETEEVVYFKDTLKYDGIIRKLSNEETNNSTNINEEDFDIEMNDRDEDFQLEEFDGD